MLQSMKFRILAATLIVAGLAACSSNPDKVTRNPLHPEEISQREQRLQAAALYAAARDSLDSADYDTAIQRYTTLATRFPFTDYARSEEHTSELQSLMRISYAVFCLKQTQDTYNYQSTV